MQHFTWLPLFSSLWVEVHMEPTAFRVAQLWHMEFFFPYKINSVICPLRRKQLALWSKLSCRAFWWWGGGGCPTGSLKSQGKVQRIKQAVGWTSWCMERSDCYAGFGAKERKRCWVRCWGPGQDNRILFCVHCLFKKQFYLEDWLRSSSGSKTCLQEPEG